MAKTNTGRTIILPVHGQTGTATAEFRTGGLTEAQVQVLLAAAAEPGVELVAPMDGLLSDAARPRTWTILVSLDGRLRPLTIRPDGSTR